MTNLCYITKEPIGNLRYRVYMINLFGTNNPRLFRVGRFRTKAEALEAVQEVKRLVRETCKQVRMDMGLLI